MDKSKNNLLQRANVYANIFRIILWTVVVAIPSVGGLGLLDAHESNASKIKRNIIVIDQRVSVRILYTNAVARC